MWKLPAQDENDNGYRQRKEIYMSLFDTGLLKCDMHVQKWITQRYLFECWFWFSGECRTQLVMLKDNTVLRKVDLRQIKRTSDDVNVCYSVSYSCL